jgi:hypothetical protein
MFGFLILRKWHAIPCQALKAPVVRSNTLRDGRNFLSAQAQKSFRASFMNVWAEMVRTESVLAKPSLLCVTARNVGVIRPLTNTLMLSDYALD